MDDMGKIQHPIQHREYHAFTDTLSALEIYHLTGIGNDDLLTGEFDAWIRSENERDYCPEYCICGAR